MSLYYIIAGFFSGIVSGMGMGGGTILIPILVVLFSINQHVAQGINLLVFIPASIISLIFHFKNGLISTKIALKLVSFGVVFALFASILANNLTGNLLKKLFAVFLIIIGLYQLVSAFVIKFKKPKHIQKTPHFKLVVFTSSMFK